MRLIQPREATADTTDDNRKQRIEKVNDKVAGKLAVELLKYINCHLEKWLLLRRAWVATLSVLVVSKTPWVFQARP
jgi:hypothetical protein